MTVGSCGGARSLGAWRQLAGKGHSVLEHYQHVLRREAYFLKQFSGSGGAEAHLVQLLSIDIGDDRIALLMAS